MRDWAKLYSRIGPLRYQTSDSDCVPQTIANGLLVLRGERLKPRLLQMIWSVSLETKHGTGYVAQYTISDILNTWFTSAHFDGYEVDELPFVSYILEGSEVSLRRNNALTRSLNAGGVCFLTVRNGRHYVLLHSHSRGTYYGFDPYWRQRKGAKTQREIHNEHFGLANMCYTRAELQAEFAIDDNQFVHVIEPTAAT